MKKNNLLNFYKKHKGYLLSSICVIGMYSFGYLLKYKHSISFTEFSQIAPISFLGVFLFSLPFRFIIGKEDK